MFCKPKRAAIGFRSLRVGIGLIGVDDDPPVDVGYVEAQYLAQFPELVAGVPAALVVIEDDGFQLQFPELVDIGGG